MDSSLEGVPVGGVGKRGKGLVEEGVRTELVELAEDILVVEGVDNRDCILVVVHILDLKNSPFLITENKIFVNSNYLEAAIQWAVASGLAPG